MSDKNDNAVTERRKVYTDEQMNAITCALSCDEKSGTVISAAAGSGKTAVLTEIVTRLVVGGTSISDIAVATFTNKAAEEIKERIRAELEKTGSLTAETAAEMDTAPISTVHSLCLDAISANPALYGLKNGFTVLDSSDAVLLRKEAIDETLSDCDYEILSGLTGGETGTRKALEDCLAHSSRVPCIDSFLDEQAKLYNGGDIFLESLLPVVQKLVSEYCSYAAELCNEILSCAESDAVRGTVEDDIDRINRIRAAKISADNAAELIQLTKLKRWSAKGEDKDVADQLKKIRDKEVKANAVDKIKSILETVPSFTKEAAELCKSVTYLITLCKRFLALYSQKKMLANAIEFDDMEKLFLSNKSKNTSFKYVIGDEFQDSNPVQYDIFNSLGGKKIFVGDIKQSIYGFRKADPRVFESVLADENFKKCTLSKNFRSRKTVIDTVNKVFTPLMSYYEPLSYGGGGENDEEINDGGLYETELVLCGKGEEPEYAAKRILKMVADGFKVRDKGGERPCNFGDFAVLTRGGKSNFDVYKKVFTKYGIPVSVQGLTNYLNLDGVESAVSFLAVISNPYDEFSLLNTLVTLFGFTPGDLADIKEKKENLFTAVNRNKKTEKCGQFLAYFRYWRQISDNNSVSVFVRRLLNEGVFAPLMYSYGARENLRQLSYYAQKFDEGKDNFGEADFVSYLRQLKREGAMLQEAVSEVDVNTVKLTTIHSSKGLEYPVVFVARITSRLGSANSDSRVSSFHKVSFSDFALAADYINERGRFTALTTVLNKLNAESKEFEEEKRILYVAATRAKDKLIFTGERRDSISRKSFYYMLKPANIKENDSFIDICTNITYGTTSHSEIQILSYNTAVPVPEKLTATSVGVDKAVSFESTDEPSVFPRNPLFLGGGKLTGKKRGDAYHKMMELLNFSDMTSEKAVYEAMEKARVEFTRAEYDCIDKKDIAAFFASDLGKRAVKAKEVVKEFKLCTEMTPDEVRSQFGENVKNIPFIQGIADMFFCENGEIVLVDYKTNRNTSPQKLSQEYKGQLFVYKRAIERMNNITVKQCYLYSFWLSKEVEIVFDK